MRRTLFGAFLLDRGISFRRAGEDLGVSHVAIREWAMGEGSPESEATREKIERWTRGAVKAVSFITDKERRARAEARAFDKVAPLPSNDALPSTGTKG